MADWKRVNDKMGRCRNDRELDNDVREVVFLVLNSFLI
jgi:hypothetical protein